MALKAIILDWDGTLRDAFDQQHQAYNAAFAALGMPEWDEATARAIIGSMPDAELFAKFFGEQAAEAEAICMRTHDRLNREAANLPPQTVQNAQALIDYLRTLKPEIFIGIVSSSRGSVVRDEITRLGWSDVFDNVVAAGEAPHDKPHRDAMHKALEGTGIQPHEVIHIGDSGSDRDLARNCQSKLLVIGDRVKEGLRPSESLPGLAQVKERLQRMFAVAIRPGEAVAAATR